MALKNFVKISSISNLSDARYCAGMLVNILGFNIDNTTKNYVSVADFSEITNWVTGVPFAGEFSTCTIEDIKIAITKYTIDFIQIDQINLLEEVKKLGKSIIFRLNINKESELRQLKEKLFFLKKYAKIIIIKSENFALHTQLDNHIKDTDDNYKILKGYGIETIQKNNQFSGLELEATEEERPGYKDYGQIMDVLELIEEYE